MMPTIAICWIGIGAYNVLFEEFYASFSEKFCNECQRTFFVFTDQPDKYANHPDVQAYEISHACTHKGFVLFRKWKYCLLAEDRYADYDYVVFANGNMVCKEAVSIAELTGGKSLAVITHPCIQYIRAGTRICDSRSLASFCPTEDWQYKQAGFNISTSREFLKMANTIEGWRHMDKASGNDRYVPWHDETYANRYFYENRSKINVLNGQIYCFPSDVQQLASKYALCKLYTRNKSAIIKEFSNRNCTQDAYQL